MLTASAYQGSGVGLEANSVHVNGVEFGTEAINTVPAWLTRPIQNWSISAVVADVELCWAEGFSDAVRWILGF